MDIGIVLYLVLGVLFAVVASLVLQREGRLRIALVTGSAVVLLLVIGIWLENKVPDSERAIGFPILLALLTPTLAIAFVWAAAEMDFPSIVQWIMGEIGWVAGFFVTAVAALYLNWIVF